MFIDYMYLWEHLLIRAYIQGITTNIIWAIIVLILIDSWIKDRDEVKKIENLKKINKRKSESIDFLINRLAFNIIDYLGIKKLEDYRSENIDFINWRFFIKDFEKFLNDSTFENKLWDEINKIIDIREKVKYIKGFTKIIQQNSETIMKELSNVYPKPLPEIIEIFEHDINYFCWGLEAIFDVFDFENRKIKKNLSKKQLSDLNNLPKNGVDVFIKLWYILLMPKMWNLFQWFINTSKKALWNELFSII